MQTVMPSVGPAVDQLRSLRDAHSLTAQRIDAAIEQLVGSNTAVPSNGHASEAPSGSRTEQLVAFLAEASEPQSTDAIAKALGVKESNAGQIVRNAIRAHKRTGVMRFGKGLFGLSKHK